MSKERFYKVYSNLPEDIRKEIIVIVDDKPYTWDVAFLEVSNETNLGLKILQKLIEMGII
jgi:UV DNA damage repair endonuclease